MDEFGSEVLRVVVLIFRIGVAVVIGTKNGIFPESVFFVKGIRNWVKSDEEVVSSYLWVGIVFEIVADDDLGDEGFGFGEDVVGRDVVKGAESFWIGVGDIGDMEIGLRVGEGVWSDFLLFHV